MVRLNEMKTNNGKMMTNSHAYTSSNKNKNNNTVLSSSSQSPFNNNRLENVLILQGGGSLGAFGCGVFKSLANHNIKIDIVAGTSIGGINAAIIAGSKDEKYPEQMLEQFWLELSEGFVDLHKITLPPSSSSIPKFVEEMLVSSGYYYNLLTYLPNDYEQRIYPSNTMNANKSASEQAIKMQAAKIILQLCHFWK